MGDTTYDQSKKGKCAINYDRLGPVCEERFYPLHNLWMDSIECKFLNKELVVYLVKSLSVIQVDRIKIRILGKCLQDIIKMMKKLSKTAEK